MILDADPEAVNLIGAKEKELFLNQRKGYAEELDKSGCASTGFELGF